MRRRLFTTLLASCATAAAALPLIASAGPGGGGLPDLRADPPENPYIQRYGTSSPRLLVRFDGFVTNVGAGPLDVAGNPSTGTMVQRRWTGSTFVTERSVPVEFETADGHNHWHLMRVMRYSLRAGTDGGSPEVAPGQKVGFCLVDSEWAPAPSPPRAEHTYSTTAGFNADFCGSGQRGLTSLRMGVSVGWRDVYHDLLAFQWVDVSSTAPGTYYVAAEADPNGLIAETDDANPPAVNTLQPVTVPGHVATPVGPVAVASEAPTSIALTSRTVGTPGARAFRITRAPANGTLGVPVNADFTGPTITYTPRAGFSGDDSFEFAAVTTTGDSRGFPRSPGSATATLRVGGVATQASVSISGAPGSIVAGTAVQLQATVAGARPGVTWSASAGTIDASGMFTAPASVPPGGAVVVRATSAAAPSAAAEVAIAVTPPPVPVAAPGLGAIAAMPRRIAVKRSGRTMVVRVVPPRSGRLVIAAARGGKALRVCVRRAGAGRRVACALRLPARVTGKPVRVVARLRASGIRWGASAISRR